MRQVYNPLSVSVGNVAHGVAFSLGFVAALPYEGAEPARARQWVRENVTSGGKLTIGTANFELYSGEQERILRIIAAWD